nr:MAG TPA: hypothetical protein [Ackermannviridae sp.]
MHTHRLGIYLVYHSKYRLLTLTLHVVGYYRNSKEYSHHRNRT